MDQEDRPTTASAQEFVDALAEPAVVFDRHLDVVAANRLATAVSGALVRGGNLARSAFLDPDGEESADEWEAESHRTAQLLRESVEQHEHDDRFRRLVGELMARSTAFAAEWAAERTDPPARGTSVVQHPVVGRLLLRWEHLLRRDDDEHVLVVWAPADEDSATRLGSLRESAGR